VERRQAFGDNPFEVEFGEAGEGGEVSVEERESVIVVLEVERPSHTLGKLVDEAELAVVVAGLHLVEHCGVHLRTERLTGALADYEIESVIISLHDKIDLGFVGEQLPADDITRNLARDGEDFVAGT